MFAASSVVPAVVGVGEQELGRREDLGVRLEEVVELRLKGGGDCELRREDPGVGEINSDRDSIHKVFE